MSARRAKFPVAASRHVRMKAKYPGFCNACKMPVAPGDEIFFYRGEVLHTYSDCAPPFGACGQPTAEGTSCVLPIWKYGRCHVHQRQ